MIDLFGFCRFYFFVAVIDDVEDDLEINIEDGLDGEDPDLLTFSKPTRKSKKRGELGCAVLSCIF